MNSCLSCSQWIAIVSELITMLDQRKGHIRHLPVFPLGLDEARIDAIKGFSDALLDVFPLQTSTYGRRGPLLRLRCMMHDQSNAMICIKLGCGMCNVLREPQIWHRLVASAGTSSRTRSMGRVWCTR